MARVNISIPDELHLRARRAGLNVSRLAADALESELRRRAKADAMMTYLAELDDAMGVPTGEEVAAAAGWAEQLDMAKRP